MKILKFALGVVCLAVLLSACGPGGQQADAYPEHAITIVVTFPPGGGTDMLARKLAGALERDLGQPVVVENRPGASGNIGARAVAEAAPDGYTLLMVNSSYAINPGVYRNLPFSPTQDLAAVINVAYVPSLVVVPVDSPLATLRAALAAAHGDQPLSFASCGNGTPQHLAGEMLHDATGARLQHVPYRGCGPALADVVSGQVAMGIVTASSAAPLVQAGKLRALAVTSAQRSSLMSAVPTVAEQGMPGYELDQWHGLLTTAGTPQTVVDQLNAAVVQVLARPAMQEDLRQLGFRPTMTTPAEFQQLVQADIARFAAVTERIGLRVD